MSWMKLMRSGALPLALGSLLTACEDSPAAPEAEALEALRSAVGPFEELEDAQQAGYEVLVVHPVNGNECLRHPQLGAMGYHYLNPALADGEVSVREPEVLIFERTRNGRFDFVAVEFIVPFSIRAADAAPPVLFGRAFKRNETFDLWALHAWVGKNNPNGTFADYNPTVSCT